MITQSYTLCSLSILEKCNQWFGYLVAPVAAKRAVRIKTAVCIARFEASSIVAIHMNVPTTAMKESQKSKNWIQVQYKGQEYIRRTMHN